MRTKELIGDISGEMESVDAAYRAFDSAQEGPCMEDYANDEEAYAALEVATRSLNSAASDLLSRLTPSAHREGRPTAAEKLTIVPDLRELQQIADFLRDEGYGGWRMDRRY